MTVTSDYRARDYIPSTHRRGTTHQTAFADMLRRCRIRHGVSMAKLARDIGRDHSLISRLEKGERNPSGELLGELADELALSGTMRFKFFATAGYIETVPTDEVAWMMAMIAELNDEELRAMRALFWGLRKLG